MRRSANLGLATAAVGLAIVIGGLRTAVAAGGAVCSGNNRWAGGGLSIACDGACPGTDKCLLSPEADASGIKWSCGCIHGDERYPYTPLDAPKCGLALFTWDMYGRMICVLQGCKGDCGEPVTLGGDLTCECSK